MNLNIYFQVCGVVILVLIMVMFSKRSVLDIPSFTAYRNLLISVFVCVCLDIESIFALIWQTMRKVYLQQWFADYI